jgi:hypothetical protein
MTRVACTLALLGLAACGDDAPPLFADPPKVEVATFPAAPARQLDLLFVIDDSTGMDGPQRALAEQLPVLFGHLAVLPGGLPDLHIGVTTTDLGTTGSGDPETPGPAIGTAGSGGCAGSGKDGALVANGAPITGAYVIDEAAGIDRERNYTGELADVVSTMLKVGAGGCGFEQPLHAVRRALSNPANARGRLLVRRCGPRRSGRHLARPVPVLPLYAGGHRVRSTYRRGR